MRKRHSSADVPALCMTGTFWGRPLSFSGKRKGKFTEFKKKRHEAFAFAKKREKAPSWSFLKTLAASFSVPCGFFLGGKALKKRAAAKARSSNKKAFLRFGKALFYPSMCVKFSAAGVVYKSSAKGYNSDLETPRSFAARLSASFLSSPSSM